MKKQFEISLDHTVLKVAKSTFDKCLKMAVAKAIATGSDEGSATLKINFTIVTSIHDDGEMKRLPLFKFKAGYSVPMKDSADGTITDRCEIIPGDEGYMLINDQVSMDEIMAEAEE